MSYFERMPNIDYPFPDFPSLEMLDIFRRVSFTKQTLKDTGNFIQYTVIDGEKPEDIAFKMYGEPLLWWVLLLSNNIIDYRNEWPKSQRELANIFDNFMKGRSLYIMEDLPVKQGDVVVRRDVAGGTASLDMETYGVVDDYDRLLHKINLKKTRGTIENGDEIYIFRKGFTASGSSGAYQPIEGFGQIGCFRQWAGSSSCQEILGPTSGYDGQAQGPHCCTSGSTFSIVQRAEDIKNSVVKFKFRGDEVNPYARYDDSDGVSGDFFGFQNLCGMTSTILYKWMRQDLSPAINPITEQDQIFEVNDKNRTINMLSPNLIPQLLDEVSLLLGSGVPRGTLKLLQY